ncbi:LamG-like jellyroll fold domain-containing protein [Pararhodobacter sp. SW119]|uniref:LamG-like jellyroll fold domain-containing protein n=1 Tax=Pararhodobacter sp. SW119 TaxID=2780075 RepID=UPI001AE00374
MNDLLPPAVALAVSIAFMASADTLAQHGAGWSLGEIDLATPYAQRAVVPVDGPGATFRFDGNSNWLEAGGSVALEPSDGLAVGAWLAFASPPGDTAAILYLAQDGLLLGLNRWRQPEIRLGNLRAAGTDPLPVGEWVHLAGDYDGETLRLRVDGDEVAQADGGAVGPIEGLFAIGRALDAGFQQGTHPLGAISGVLGAVTFRRSADPVTPGPRPDTTPDLDAPAVWFADDPDRPRAFPLGATGWTNEPHALTLRDGLWHLYFQANPNGAFWRDIVWGHQVSSDLAVWERRRPALMPTTGFDRRGVWVGNWIPDREPPAVLYSGVNGDWAGIGLAKADLEGGLSLAHVVDHDTPSEFQDMRDPWIVRTGDAWLMLIGTGSRDRSEALVYTYLSEDGKTWERTGLFDTGGAEMPGQYWELPVLLEIGDRWMLMGTPVLEGEPARTLYWLGEFDGTRFVPEDPEPRQLDILATYRAPTMARGPEGDLVAIGIVADEIRNEQKRHESGWVHVLTPATRLDLCHDNPDDLCQEFVPAFADRFVRILDQGKATTSATLSTGGRPVLLSAEVDASNGGLVRLGTRVTDEGEVAAELTIDAGTGAVRLDYTNGPVLPIGRSSVIEGMIPPSETITIEILMDGAAVFGSVNGRPLAFLAFAMVQGRDALYLSAEGGAQIEAFRLAGHE